MKIWIVSHYWDNGEEYEDFAKYEDHKFYSTRELAESVYYNHVADAYQGSWEISEKTLDTQEERVLEKSPYVKCKSWYDMQREQDDWYPEPEECYDYRQPEPEDSIQDAWNYMEDEARYLDMCESEDLENYMKTPHENYEIFKQLRDAALDDLNKALESLLNK